MPGCDFTRRDFLRWTGAAAATPFFARRTLLNGSAAIPARRDDVSPVNLELVTSPKSEPIITWYTGYTGTDDGLGRMKPAPADGDVHWGTHPSGSTGSPAAVAHTPYHYVELTGLEPGSAPITTRPASNGKPVPPTQFTLIAATRSVPPTSGSLPAGPTASRPPSRRRAGSSSPSYCATTCTWVKPKRGCSAVHRSTESSRNPA